MICSTIISTRKNVLFLTFLELSVVGYYGKVLKSKPCWCCEMEPEMHWEDRCVCFQTNLLKTSDLNAFW